MYGISNKIIFVTRPVLSLGQTAIVLSHFDPSLFWFYFIRLYFIHLETKLGILKKQTTSTINEYNTNTNITLLLKK